MPRRCRRGVAEVPRTVRRPAQVRPRPGPGLGLGIWKSGDLEIQKFGIQKIKNIKISKCKSVLPKMSARSGLVGTKASWPHFMQFQGIFPWTKNIQNMFFFANFPWWANWLYSPGSGSCAGVICKLPKLQHNRQVVVRAAGRAAEARLVPW